MNDRTVIIYSSVDGQTLKISNRLRDEFLQNGEKIDFFPVEDFNEDITNYDRVIIGSSIRYGVHNVKIIDFINTNKEQLESRRTAFFSVNLVARKPEKRTANTNPYLIKFFKSIDWRPTMVEVFAGKLDYKKYSFYDRIMIQFIMWMTKGPTKTNTEIEYTDWDRVKEFGIQLTHL